MTRSRHRQIETPQRSSAVLSFLEAWEAPAMNPHRFIILLDGAAATCRSRARATAHAGDWISQ
jgi:hypothetical protein